MSLAARTIAPDWNRRRFDWKKQVFACAELGRSAKLVAAALVTQFFDRDRPECSPGISALAEALAVHVDTVKRALRALEAGGWIDRGEGGHRGAFKVLALRFPSERRAQQAAVTTDENRPEKARLSVVKGGRSCTPFEGDARQERGAALHGKGCSRAPLSSFPPAPPYKDNQISPNGRGREAAPPRGALAREIQLGSDEARRWDGWLRMHGFPALATLAGRGSAEKRDCVTVPALIPPCDMGSITFHLAKRWAERLVRGGGDARS